MNPAARAAPAVIPVPASGLAVRALGLASAIAPDLVGRLAARRFLTPGRRPTRADEWRVLARARRSTLEVEAVRHASFTWGSASAPAVLLVHGWSGSSAQMAPFVDPLLARGLRVIAVDATAHGASEGRRTNVREMGLVVREVARAAGPLAATIAHSAGATAAVWAASHGVELGKLALIAPGEGPTEWMRSFTTAIGLEGRAVEVFHGAVAAAARVRLAYLDLEANAPDVQAEVLVVHDADDRVTPPARARALAGSFRHARLVETRGLGHRRILRAPGVVDAVARYSAGVA